MKNTTHRVVILKNVNSDLISQAILILKDSVAGTESGIMLEAEKIVEKYMGTKHGAEKGDNGIKFRIGILSAGIAVLGFGLCLLAYFV